jgi:hypothetical protein
VTDYDLLERLYDALRSPLGVIVETDDTERLRAKLYALRRKHEAREPGFHSLAFLTSPTNPTTELWIIRKNPNGQE